MSDLKNTEFLITKSSLEGYCTKGLTVAEMAKEITTASGQPCSEGTVRRACEAYNIDLKKKRRKTGFILEEQTIATPVAGNIAERIENNEEPGKTHSF